MELQETSCNYKPVDFANSVYATSPCDPDKYKPKVKIVSFSIYTLNDFDVSHEKGSDTTKYFIYWYQTEGNWIKAKLRYVLLL